MNIAPPALSVRVFGTPGVAGSKRIVPAGQRFRVIDASKKSAPWKSLVAQHAGEAMAGRELFRGPLRMDLTFMLRRPKGHYGKKGLRAGATPYPMVRPDLLKRARAVEDALSGVAYHDDAQICDERLRKVYWEQEGVLIEVWEMESEAVAFARGPRGA